MNGIRQFLLGEILRIGLRWEADIPLNQIELVELITASQEVPGRAILIASLLGQPNLRLRIIKPMTIVGMYGIQKTAQEIWLTVDDNRQLIADLEASGSAVSWGGVT
jgi:hypothetical protein